MYINTWSDKVNFSKTGIDLAILKHKNLSTNKDFWHRVLSNPSSCNEDSQLFNSSKGIGVGFGFK